MKIYLVLIITLTIFSSNLFAQPKDKEERKTRFASDTELSFIAVGGNSNNTSLNLLSRSRWPMKPKHILKFGGHFTYATDEKTLDAKNWDVNIRYEWKFKPRWGFYVGTIYEVDTFAGYQARDNVDVGFLWDAIITKKTDLDFEAGYRWMYEKDVEDVTEQDHKFRLYGRWDQTFTKFFGVTWWVEYLPNFTRSEDWMFNTEPSVWFNVIEILAFKFGYRWMYRGLPPVDRKKSDFTSTASLILKY